MRCSPMQTGRRMKHTGLYLRFASCSLNMGNACCKPIPLKKCSPETSLDRGMDIGIPREKRILYKRGYIALAGKPKRYSLFFVNERNRFYTIRLQIRFEKATGSSMETPSISNA